MTQVLCSSTIVLPGAIAPDPLDLKVLVPDLVAVAPTHLEEVTVVALGFPNCTLFPLQETRRVKDSPRETLAFDQSQLLPSSLAQLVVRGWVEGAGCH